MVLQRKTKTNLKLSNIDTNHYLGQNSSQSQSITIQKTQSDFTKTIDKSVTRVSWSNKVNGQQTFWNGQTTGDGNPQPHTHTSSISTQSDENRSINPPSLFDFSNIFWCIRLRDGDIGRKYPNKWSVEHWMHGSPDGTTRFSFSDGSLSICSSTLDLHLFRRHF